MHAVQDVSLENSLCARLLGNQKIGSRMFRLGSRNDIHRCKSQLVVILPDI